MTGASAAAPRVHARTDALRRGTPPVTTGCQITGTEIVHQQRSSFGVHWLQGVTDSPEEELLDYFVQECGLTAPEVVAPWWSYRYAVRFAEGVRVMWDHPSGKSRCAVLVDGETCEALGWRQLSLVALPLRLTRLDLAFDGHEISPWRFAWAVERRLARTKLQTPDWHVSAEGQTYTLGRKGGVQVQCYNRRGFNRLELRMWGNRADAYQQRGGFLASVEAARSLGLGFLRDVIDFVDPQSDSNQSRRSLLPWWESFVEDAAKAGVRLPPRPPSCLARKRAFVDRIGKCLAEVERGWPGSVGRAAFVGLRELEKRGVSVAPGAAGVGVGMVTSVERRAERPSKARSVRAAVPGGLRDFGVYGAVRG